MTAEERLKQLAGMGGTAAALLLAIGVGSTTAEALNDYSAINEGTAAEHLLADGAHRGWNTNQGIAANAVKFIPIHDGTAVVGSFSANAQTCTVEVEGRHLTEAVPYSTSVCSGSSCVAIQTNATAQAGESGATSGACNVFVSTCSSVAARGAGVRCFGGAVGVSGGADAVPNSTFAGARSVVYLDVLAIQNPTDEELVAFLLYGR